MAFRAKNRDEASAYFAGWYAAEYDDKGICQQVTRPTLSQYLDNTKAFNAGYREYNFYVKGK